MSLIGLVHEVVAGHRSEQGERGKDMRIQNGHWAPREGRQIRRPFHPHVTVSPQRVHFTRGVHVTVLPECSLKKACRLEPEIVTSTDASHVFHRLPGVLVYG